MSAAAGGAASGAAADAAPADPHKFDPHILVSRFRTCKEHLHDIPIKEFVEGCDEIKKIVCAFGGEAAGRTRRATPAPTAAPAPPLRPADTLGAAFGIASADITEKTGIMMQRCVRRAVAACFAADSHPPALNAAAATYTSPPTCRPPVCPAAGRSWRRLRVPLAWHHHTRRVTQGLLPLPLPRVVTHGRG